MLVSNVRTPTSALCFWVGPDFEHSFDTSLIKNIGNTKTSKIIINHLM